jgi:hypothetical protein
VRRIVIIQHCDIKHEGALMAIMTAGQPAMKLCLGRAISHTGDDGRVQWHTSLWEHTAWVTTVRRGSSCPGLTTRRYMDGAEMVFTVSVRPGSKARGDLAYMDGQQLTHLPTVVRRYD